MSDPIFSPSWYRVAELRPRLRRHARIHRHLYRDRPWYVLQDLTSQRFHRFSPAAYSVIGLMDGERSVADIWEIATERLGDDAPTQDELIRLMAQLHAADVLQSDVPPDTAELLERHERKSRRELWGRMLNPFAIRIPLWDPERFLARGLPWVRSLIGVWGALLWLAVVVPAVVLAGIHWTELTEGFVDRVLTPQNLVLIYLLFPIIKGLHELGHGFAAKAFGGEIHDMGIMLLVFTPVPYVDASSASAFPEKRRRALVGAAGMAVELLLSALAMFVWLEAESGVVRAVAFNAMVIGGVTTLGFNANPLLRFDGYYILADLIEIPNLRQRANQFLGYLAERYAFGHRRAERPAAQPGERAWFVGYAVASFAYRMVVVAAILLFVLDLSLLLGIVLGAIASVTWLGMPLVKGVRHLLEPRFRSVRTRAVSVVAMAVLGVGLLLVIPVPFRTVAEGVVWVPEDALVRARSDGFVSRVVAKRSQRVRSGDLLIECRDPDLVAEVDVLEAQLRGLDVRFHQERVNDPARAEMVEEQRRHLRKRLVRARERLAGLTIRSGVDGVFVAPLAADLPGRFVRQGELLARVVDPKNLTVRTVVAQDDIDLVLGQLERVDVRLSERLDPILPVTVRRVVPTPSAELPSPALGSLGGGRVAVDPRDERGVVAVERLYLVELQVADASALLGRPGGRVYVRFDHGRASLASQFYRGLRQLFLSRLDV